jgi:DNA-binding NarL/FixJ family response regulator
VKHKIYILDDHPVVIEGSKKILESQEDLQVVGTSEDASIA